MSHNQLGPIEVQCDAPPYHIVEACYLIGIESPEDVRWCRMNHFRRRGGWRALLTRHPIRALRQIRRRRGNACTCGEPLPRLARQQFVTVVGNQVSYLLGQCRRCRTVFWEEG